MIFIPVSSTNWCFGNTSNNHNDHYADNGYYLLSTSSVLCTVAKYFIYIILVSQTQGTHFQDLCLLNYKMGMMTFVIFIWGQSSQFHHIRPECFSSAWHCLLIFPHRFPGILGGGLLFLHPSFAIFDTCQGHT